MVALVLIVLSEWWLWLGSDEKENTTASTGDNKTADSGTRPASDDKDFHRFDEQVNVCLDCCDPDMPTLPRKYIRYIIAVCHTITTNQCDAFMIYQVLF